MDDVSVITLSCETDCAEYAARYVDIAKFNACCAECRGYGKAWACPPYDFAPIEIWRGYNRLLLYGKKVVLPEALCREEHERGELARLYNSMLAPIKTALLDELFAMERETPGSMALSAGGCDICESCTRPEGKPCRFPEKKRFSVESIGGDVIRSIEDFFGEKVLWADGGHLPQHFILLGGLLKK